MKFIDYLKQSSEEKISKEQQQLVKRRELQLNSDILATESALENKKEELEDMKYSGNNERIISLYNEVEGLEKGLAILNNLKAELF
jgi:hypothetical protein